MPERLQHRTRVDTLGEQQRRACVSQNGKPRWDGYANDPPATFVVRSELSVWIGGAARIFGIAMVARWLLA